MIENSFLESGFSFTMAKLLPYIITVLIGLILVFLLRNKLRIKNKFLLITVKLIVIAAPFGIYFATNPIYEGDFSNNCVEVERKADYDELEDGKLYVLSIPGCPFCKMAMSKMIQLEERNPGLEIEYVVCSEDPSTMDFYTENNEGKIPVQLAQKPSELMDLSEGTFPTYVLVKKNEPLKTWSNQNFGVRALDEVESLVVK